MVVVIGRIKMTGQTDGKMTKSVPSFRLLLSWRLSPHFSVPSVIPSWQLSQVVPGLGMYRYDLPRLMLTDLQSHYCLSGGAKNLYWGHEARRR